MISALLISAAMATTPNNRSLPLYLDAASFKSTLANQQDRWDSCHPDTLAEPLTIEVILTVAPNGTVEQASAMIANEVAPCWAKAAAALDFPSHDGTAQRFEFELLLHENGLLGPIELRWGRRAIEPLYLYIPASLDTTQRQSLLDSLGIQRSSATSSEESR